VDSSCCIISTSARYKFDALKNRLCVTDGS
jgi:hypothetical protein